MLIQVNWQNALGSPCAHCITMSKQGYCYLLPEARQATGFIIWRMYSACI